MTYEAFSEAAQGAFDDIPAEYKAGIDGLSVESDVRRHPSFPEVVTLGECVTESYPSEWSGPDTVRSRVVLYHGSFLEVADGDPDFDWEAEIWETLTHELQHHLESLAGEDSLEHVDYAVDESFKRSRGQPFDPFYYRHGEELGDGLYRVEDEYFLEWFWPSGAHDRELELTWGDVAWTLPLPTLQDDVHFVEVEGVDVEGEVGGVGLIRKRSGLSGLLDALRRVPLSVRATRVGARPLGS